MHFNSILLLLLLLLPLCVSSECSCEESAKLDNHTKIQGLKFKAIAIASILVAGAVGVCIPQLGKIMFQSFDPEESIVFLTVKFFAAGVILATGFVHVLPDANESLDDPCLGDGKVWGDFPMGSFVAMLAAVSVMMLETAVTSLVKRSAYSKQTPELPQKQNGHMHGPSESLLRNRIVSQVLEVGIIIHSVIIGISLGVSVNPNTIKPLIAALSFHQMFEGMGLGSCITEAKFKFGTVLTMLIFFSLTTPTGIAIGIGISNTYDANSSRALIIQGILNATSAGILIYMALVDLLAADFMKTKVQTSFRLQIIAFISLLLGIGCMSLLAKWA